MRVAKEPIHILFAEDDTDDQLIVREAFTESDIKEELFFVKDGIELLDYLYGKGRYSDRSTYPLPDIIFTDINMPRMNGFEVIKQIKSDPHFRKIPIIVLSGSKMNEDILQSYELGANSYITKKLNFDCVKVVVEALQKYWFGIVELPDEK